MNAGERFDVEDFESPLKFFIDGLLLQADIRRHLPAEADGSLDGYVRRIRRTLGNRLFGLVVTEYPPYDAQSWLRLREFLRPLYELIGIPGNLTQTGLFMGDYTKTPFGIHKDPHATFVFVIAGRKTFRVWPPEVFDQNLENTRKMDYERFLDRATTLTGEPGDVLFWPAHYWHVAESVGGFAASLSLAIFQDALPSVATLEQALRKISARSGKKDSEVASLFHPDRLSGNAAKIPRLVKKALRALRTASESQELEQAMEVEWLNRLTSFGFDSSPSPLPVRRLTDDQIVCGDFDYPILWLARGEEELACSANGHSFSVGAQPRTARLFERLNNGTPVRVADLVEEFACSAVVKGVRFEATADDIRSLIEKFVSIRALTVEC